MPYPGSHLSQIAIDVLARLLKFSKPCGNKAGYLGRESWLESHQQLRAELFQTGILLDPACALKAVVKNATESDDDGQHHVVSIFAL